MMKKWRVGLIILSLVCLMSGLIYRLYQIQISSTHAFSVAQKDLVALAEDVQSRETVLMSNRGKIFDRRGIPLVGEVHWRLFVFPQSKEQLELQRNSLQKLSELLGISYRTLQQQIVSLKRPAVLSPYILTQQEISMVESLHIPGIIAVQSDNRMTEGQIAKSVIGRLIRNSYIVKTRYAEQLKNGSFSLQSRVGMTGLEYAFERYLHGEGERLLRFVTDGRGRALNGIQVKVTNKPSESPIQPHHIVTTLDQRLQVKTEEILHKANVKEGAIVVQHIASGDILAIASASNDPWVNEALVEATPGSIFKTVVAIAALEEGISTANSRYHCQGKLQGGKYHLRDADGAIHGKQTLAEAYANSCNIVLGSVAEQLGGAKLQSYAKRLGLAQKIGWRGKVAGVADFSQLPEESTGLIYAPTTPLTDRGATVQTAIGQRDVKVTPLQAANMITALFHRGMPLQPRLVTEIRDAKGKPIWKFQQQTLPGSKPFKPSTIAAAKEMMRLVVTKGTARSLAKNDWQLAGKTGTAQVGIHNEKYHKWMVGFAPYSKPTYAVSVVVKNVNNANDNRSKQIYQEVMSALQTLNK